MKIVEIILKIIILLGMFLWASFSMLASYYTSYLRKNE